MVRQFVKAANSVAAGYSFLAGIMLRRPVITGMPPAISFELTNHCNLSCPECASGSGMMTRERGFMEPALFERIMTEIRPYLYYVSLYFQGEPMMHPDFFRFTHSRGDVRIIVSTNGHFDLVAKQQQYVGLG